MKSDSPIIEITELKKTYVKNNHHNQILKGINLKVSKGKFIVIMGPSGSGKSTLLNILGLLDDATDGNYILDGQVVKQLTDREKTKIRYENIGFVFQDFNLLSHLTAVENLTFPLFLRKDLSAKERMKRSMELLDKVHLSHRRDHFPKELSGGEQQRVAIARSLINQPKVIFADEPTGNVDSESEIGIIQLFQDIVVQGTSIVLVTHNELYKQYADEIFIMRDGHLNREGGNNHAN